MTKLKLNNENELKALLAELDIHKVEYSKTREEIKFWLDSQRHYLSFIILIFGAGFGTIPFILQHKIFGILLAFPLVFFSLILQIINCGKRLRRFSNYLLDILIPRVNHILEQLQVGTDDKMALGWQKYFIEQRSRKTKTVSIIWIPILASCVYLGFYLFIIINNQYYPTIFEISIFLIDIIVIIYFSTTIIKSWLSLPK